MSLADVMLRYLRERYPTRRFVPLALVLAAVGVLASPVTTGLSMAFARATAFAYVTVLLLRVWDDLEDRAADAAVHPQRVTVTSPATMPFYVLQLVCAVLAIVVLANGPEWRGRMIALATGCIVLAAWYGIRRAVSPPPMLNAHVLLLKYPAIALLAAPSRVNVETAPIFALVYLCLCVFESRDDPVLRGSRTAVRVAIAECALMVPLLWLVFTNESTPYSHIVRGMLP